ncbi:serine/threonine protein kinase, partial [Propionibacterium freudenreichii]
MTQDNSGSAEKPFRLGTNYQVETPLGHGVIGTTWRGTGAGGAELAFTVLNKRFASNPQVVRHLLAQRPVLATVRGDHVVPVVDMVADSDVVAVVSPYIKGTDLRSRLDDEGTLPPAEACRIISETAQGLATLHATGLTHRDVKPSNILLDDTQQPASAKVTDYAVGGIVEEWAGGGHSAVLASTPAYLSPEVIAGDPVTVQSDMYALGVVLYESLCGVTPFAPLQPEGTMQAILTLDPGRPRGVDDALWEVLSMLLNRDPRQRGSADALSWRLSELQNALADAPKLPRLDVSPPPSPLPQVMAFPGAAPTTAPHVVGQEPDVNQAGADQLAARDGATRGSAAGVLSAGAVIGAAAATVVPAQQAAAQPAQATSGPSDGAQVAGGQAVPGQAGLAEGQSGPAQNQSGQGQPVQGQPGQQTSPQSGVSGQAPVQPASDQPAPRQGAASQPGGASQ